MVEIKLHQDIIRNGYTLVDNVFLSNYLITADALDVKIYLYGLHLISTGSSVNLTDMALKLKLDEERIKAAYLYWEKQGLVVITRTEPVSLIYVSPKNPMPKVTNFDPNKYRDFVEEVNRLFPHQDLTSNEYNSYFELMEFSGIEQNALLQIMQYCKRIKNDKVGTPYILAVANNWISEGLRTFDDVTNKIDALETNSEAVRQIYETLGLKSAVDIDSRQAYQSWLEDGYTLDAILTAARLLKKRGGISKLITLMKDLKKAGAYNPFEIEEYGKKLKKLNDIALGVVKGIGGYYGSMEVIVDTYVRTWVNDMGFAEDALLSIAHYCFVSNIKSLDGLNEYVKKFYKLNLITAEAISTYIAKKVQIDSEIKDVLEIVGSPRIVSTKDRDFYTTWTEKWSIRYELIALSADFAKGKNFAFSHINRLLSQIKNTPDISADDAKSVFIKLDSLDQKPSKKKEMLRHEYTKEELSSVFTNLDSLEV